MSSNVALRYDLKGALESLDAVAQAGDAKASSTAKVAGSIIDKSRTAIAYSDDNRLCIGPNLDTLLHCFPMMKSIVQSFLHDPVQADRYRRREIEGQVADVNADLRPRRVLVVLHGKQENFIRSQSL